MLKARIPKLFKSMFAFAALTLASDQHVFGIDGKSILCVPDADLDPLLKTYADESTHLQPGSGHTPGFGFLFRPETMKSVIPGYVVVQGFEGHPYANALSGTVGFLDPNDRARLGPAMRARTIEDEWYARDQCPQPIIRPLPGTKLYEVKCSTKADYATIWNRAPDPQITVPNPNDFVVATCQYENIHLGPYAGKKLKNCARVVIIDGFLVDYRFQEENVAAVPQIDSLIREKLAQWKKNCSSPAKATTGFGK
ncbi:MAG TPA: hypothetical protein VKY65_13400 [Alphaproteobacteria bacterium]|nr:hypothetical protein [Alphaproteobacteria bacterium]